MKNSVVLRFVKAFAVMATAVAISVTALAPSLPAKAMSAEDDAFFYLTDTLGFNVAAACGIMANIRHESNFHPGALNSAGSYGICQWTGGRRWGLESYCDSNGFDYESLHGQLSFLAYELRTYYPGIYNYLMSVDNSSEGAYNAAYRFCYDFERPADRGGQSSSRGSLATGTYWYRYKLYAYDQWLDTEYGRVYHYTDGTIHYGWLDLDGDRYYLDQDGILKTGLFSAEGSSYFSDEDGILQYGWVTIGNSTYYFDEETGAMQVGWIEDDGKMYFLDSNGKLESINSFNDKAETTDADIQSLFAEKEIEPETSVNAPAADPVPLPDNISDIAQSIQNAGSDSQSSAAAVATPGQETEVKAGDLNPSNAVEGNTIDTTKLDVGTQGSDGLTMDGAGKGEGGADKIVFEGADATGSAQ